jgi:hypothetical protein
VKGSEVTLFRVGGVKRRIGHHKVNRHISSSVASSILKQLNITKDEWFCAAKKYSSATQRDLGCVAFHSGGFMQNIERFNQGIMR